MNQTPQKSHFRSIGMAAWALLTLVLFFCVLLLANELLKSGKSPLELADVNGMNIEITPSTPSSSQLKDVLIYVANADGSLLVPERRSIPFGPFTVENCRAALEELRKPATSTAHQPILPSSAEFNALYLENGELVIDFTASLQASAKKSASAEALMVYGVVNTLTQDVLRGEKGDPVTSVRFLLSGAVPGESFPAHFDLSQPVTPDPSWIKAEQ